MCSIKNVELYERVKGDFYLLLDTDYCYEVVIRNTFMPEYRQNMYQFAFDDTEVCDSIFSRLWSFNSELLCYNMKECINEYIDYLEERVANE